MKKRLTALLLTLCLALSLAACSSGGSSEQPQAQEPSPAENTEAPADAEESGGEEAPAEEAVPEEVLNSYGLTAEEFAALKASIQEHIAGEWGAEEAYLSLDNGSVPDLWKTCTLIRDEVEKRYGTDESQDMRKDEAMESYINSGIEEEFSADHLSGLSSLWKERTLVLAHAVNAWTEEQSISYDLYYHIWDMLSSGFTAMMIEDDTYVGPLFDFYA